MYLLFTKWTTTYYVINLNCVACTFNNTVPNLIFFVYYMSAQTLKKNACTICRLKCYLIQKIYINNSASSPHMLFISTHLNVHH